MPRLIGLPTTRSKSSCDNLFGDVLSDSFGPKKVEKRHVVSTPDGRCRSCCYFAPSPKITINIASPLYPPPTASSSFFLGAAVFATALAR